MNNQPQYTFTIDRNKRHQVQIESIKANEFGQVSEGVFFTKEYEHAISILNSIIDIQKSNDDKNCDCHVEEQKSCCSKNQKLGRNNIILFTGERGSGKTSTILSFGQFLENNKINGKKFKCLPLIDPSYFDNNNNILKSVLTTMFKMAKCMLKCQNNNDEHNDYSDLWKRFDKVFKTLGDIEGARKQDYSLETLNELGESSNLQDAMQDLVKEFISKSPCKFDFLVLLIDDLDMNVSYASQMLEQIRKFLMVDNLIIVMAANLDQLQNEMRESYSSAFKHTLKENNQTLAVDVEDLATRYLLKVFPASRRIHLHNATNNLVRTKLHIVDNEDSEKKHENKYTAYEDKNLQQVILTLIWERTRLLFVPKNEDLLHPIIPSNLRDLSQFLNFLLDMKKVECDADKGQLFKDAANYSLCQQNFEKFKNYIINNWIPEKLSYEEELMFENIPQDVSEINKHLINAINVIGTKNKKRLMSREVDLEQIAKNAEGVKIDRDIYTMVSPNDPRFVKANKISDIFNQPSNYSYGDLLLMIDKYETYFESEEDRRFINAIKIYYTILLFETMFFKSNDVKYVFKNLRDDVFETIIPIQRLLGGTVYYPNYFEIITSEYFKQKGPSFDAKRAFYHKFTFQYEINKLRREYGNRTEGFRKILDKQESVLFFILYYGDVRPDRYDLKHTYDTTHYEDSLVNGVNYATFDILSLFNNALNPIHTILRSIDEIYVSIQRAGYRQQIIKKMLNRIQDWSRVCTMDKETYFSNAILPFYSVDIMLRYLRKSYSDIDIMYKGHVLAGNRNKKNRLKLNIMLQKSNCKVDELLEQLNKTGLIVTEEVKALLKSNSTILQESKDLFNKVYQDKNNNVDVVDYYRNKIIMMILSNNNIDEKKQNEIIKQVHEYKTSAEIYKYIEKVLWEDVVMEMIVRKSIQDRIRDKISIDNYYNKLWDQTAKAFDLISIKQEESADKYEMKLLYDKIFKKGESVFILGK